MKNIVVILGSVLLFFCLTSFDVHPLIIVNLKETTQQQKGSYSKEQMDSFIREVFADKADELVFKSKTKRMDLITNFLGRVTIENVSKYREKELLLLSSFNLQNKYNPKLKRDVVFDPRTFNPLKYTFKMDEKRKRVIRVDGSDFVICIQPINQ